MFLSVDFLFVTLYYHYGTTDYYDYERDISYTMQSSAEEDNRRVNVDIKWNLSE